MTKSHRFLALDALRGISALAVALRHFGTLEYSTSYLAVDFFFLLSGFILCHSYYNDLKISFRQFALARFFRLYPLHLLSLILVVGGTYLWGEGVPPEHYGNLALHVFMVQNMGFGPNGVIFNIPAWSISVEFWLNLFFFALIFLMGSLSKRTLWSLLAFGTLICFGLLFGFRGELNAVTNLFPYVSSALLRGFGSFALGILVFILFQKQSSLLKEQKGLWAAELICLVSLIGIYLNPAEHSRSDFIMPILFALTVLVFALEADFVSRYLKKLARLGDISFSIYLLHWPLMIAFKKWLPDAPAFDFVLVLIVVAGISWLYFEVPVYKFLRKRFA